MKRIFVCTFALILSAMFVLSLASTIYASQSWYYSESQNFSSSGLFTVSCSGCRGGQAKYLGSSGSSSSTGSGWWSDNVARNTIRFRTYAPNVSNLAGIRVTYSGSSAQAQANINMSIWSPGYAIVGTINGSQSWMDLYYSNRCSSNGAHPCGTSYTVYWDESYIFEL